MVNLRIVRRIIRIRLLHSCLVALLLSTLASAQGAPLDGRALFIEPRKGNCNACHKTPTDALLKSAANIGPPLESIKQNYATQADRARLRETIVDQSRRNPATIMPPYGKHRILTEAEIDAIIVYLETL